MSMREEKRRCVCGYDVKLMYIFDAHSPPNSQFVCKDINGDPITTDFCPVCDRNLRDSTSKVEQ